MIEIVIMTTIIVQHNNNNNNVRTVVASVADVQSTNELIIDSTALTACGRNVVHETKHHSQK